MSLLISLIPKTALSSVKMQFRCFPGIFLHETLSSVHLMDAGGMRHDTRVTLSFIPDSYQLTVSLTDETGKNQSERLIAVANGVIQMIIYESDTTHLLSAACIEFGRLDQYYVRINCSVQGWRTGDVRCLLLLVPEDA